jgi:alpha-1,2-mannosyltransferase
LIITRRARGALHAVITFIVCEAIAFLAAPSASWTYWTKEVLDSKRAGALLYTSDQNLSSALQRFHHGAVSAWVIVPSLVVIGVGGLLLAAWAHRRSSVVLGLVVCATTGLIVSPITWVHHMVWVVPVIIWLAAGADRPRWGRWLAGISVVLFVAAPIWWVPTSWSVTAHPPELHQDYWQLLLGNSFLFAMLAFLAGVTVMLGRRSGVLSLRGAMPALPARELGEPLSAAIGRARADIRREDTGGQSGPLVTIGATQEGPAGKDLELVGSEGATGPAG